MSNGRIVLRFLFLSLPFVALLLLVATHLNFFINWAAIHLLQGLSNQPIDWVVQRDPLFGDLYLLRFIGRYPTPLFSLGVAAASAGGLYVGLESRVLPRSIGIYLSLICFVTFLSAIIFIFIPDSFPYNIQDYCELYMKMQIGIWFMIPLMLGFAFSILATPLWEQGLVVAAALLYSVIFSLARYVVYLYLLEHGSYVFMATMFIAFNPPLDTIFIVGFYSFYLSFLSGRMDRKGTQWVS
jgi:hypothetical protein